MSRVVSWASLSMCTDVVVNHYYYWKGPGTSRVSSASLVFVNAPTW